MTPARPARRPAGPGCVIVMGVSGSGKSAVGAALADALGLPFADGDDFHPARNVAKMSAGQPLGDTDRWPWLDAIGGLIDRWRAAGQGGVVACSALRRSYRDRLRAGRPQVRFAFLDVPRSVLVARLADRPGHFMPASLLDSQLATLEPPSADEPTVRVPVDAATTVAAVVRMITARPAVAAQFPGPPGGGRVGETPIAGTTRAGATSVEVGSAARGRRSGSAREATMSDVHGGQPSTGVKRTELQRAHTEVPGRLIVQTLFQIPVGQESGRHNHPGEEVGYLIQGDIVMEFDDRPPLTVHSGEPFLIPPGAIHNARNIGTVETRMLSSYFVDDSRPLVTTY